MNSNKVGAGILNIVTESLYDKPIVVFREYVQNSVDSFLKIQEEVNIDTLEIVIWRDDNNLYFLDNGAGITDEDFFSQMTSIALSYKSKTSNLGYKGIGRLSGVPYCEKLEFINICNYEKNDYQRYSISNAKYYEMKKKEDYNHMTFEQLMQEIGEFENFVTGQDVEHISSILAKYAHMFSERKKGFLVCLKGIKPILNSTISNSFFIEDLEWLLPVKFKKELLSSDVGELIREITEGQNQKNIPAQAYKITFNGQELERPITVDMLRDYTCKCDLMYGVCIHTFNSDKITITKGNKFSGIRIYIDNMLLCDEQEFLPILQQYGLINHTANELIQTVKGIGGMIYITDKVSISANARRTFIELTDNSSIDFLKRICEFVENIYETRYALSNYSSAKKNIEEKTIDINELKQKANDALAKLAQESIELKDTEGENKKSDFNKLSLLEQKKIIKQKINKALNNQIRNYLLQASQFDYENAYEDFKTWLLSN